jgi:hypothetical protein
MGIVGKTRRSHGPFLQRPGPRNLYLPPGQGRPLIIRTPGKLKIPLAVKLHHPGIIPRTAPFRPGDNIGKGITPGGKRRQGSAGGEPVEARNLRIFPERRETVMVHRINYRGIFLFL